MQDEIRPYSARLDRSRPYSYRQFRLGNRVFVSVIKLTCEPAKMLNPGIQRLTGSTRRIALALGEPLRCSTDLRQHRTYSLPIL